MSEVLRVAGDNDRSSDEVAEVGTGAIEPPVDPLADHEADVALDALRDVAAWACAEHGASSLSEALELADAEPKPREVREALQRLAEVDVASFARTRLSSYDLEQAFVELESTVGERAWGIYVRRKLTEGKPPTLDDLGRELRVTRERIRQLEVQAREAVDQVARMPDSIINRAALRVGRSLGAVAQLGRATTAIQAVDPHNKAFRAHPERARLILNLAGPYQRAGDWLVRAGMDAEIARALDEVMADGPVPVESVLTILSDHDVRPEVREAWLADSARYRRLGYELVRWDGSLANKAALVLEAADEPMTVAEIFETIGEQRSVRTLANYLQSDARFMRRGLEHYGLRKWGGEEYTTIVEEIEQELERQGGQASLDHLVRTLCDNFGVSENSVRTYSMQHPLFSRTTAGEICLRHAPAPAPTHQPIEETKGCCWLREGWAFRVRVTFDTLRGSGLSVPTGLAGHLGLPPRGEREFASEYGPLRLTWPGIQPHMGSQRAAAEALGLEEGDLLFVEFTDDRVRWSGIRQRELAETTGIARLARELGCRDVDPAGSLAYVARALGIDPSDADADAAVRRRLLARREEDLADLLPPVQLPDATDEVLDLLASLGE